jgi:hypothetical protein
LDREHNQEKGGEVTFLCLEWKKGRPWISYSLPFLDGFILKEDIVTKKVLAFIISLGYGFAKNFLLKKSSLPKFFTVS